MLLAILDFARIASALVVVIGVTSHLGSGAALSPKRCRIASVGAHNRTEMLRLRGVLLTILRLLGLRATHRKEFYNKRRSAHENNFTTKLPRTTLGTGLARTGTNTGTRYTTGAA